MKIPYLVAETPNLLSSSYVHEIFCEFSVVPASRVLNGLAGIYK
jgi:hypothetical protein